MPSRMPSRTLRIIAFAAGLCALSGCNAKPQQASVIGHAWAGPATLNLHKEIDLKSATVTTVGHGEKLEIVGQRRRFYKVRTAAGIEGWTSDRELLDTAQMQRLKALAAETAGQPSQGIATTFSNLNVHAEPVRQSPSFIQVKEHEKVDVIAHKVAERTAVVPKRELIPPRPKAEKTGAKEGKEKSSKTPAPPAPAPPEPPPDWLELSKQGDPPPDPVESGANQAPKGPVDDWTPTVRTETGQSG